ncbi:hypothetical protein J7L49_00495 [Candidatus Bathyarchaeota archaeon]|nr:hypothetical protein [Candidatus Bathyarchaeota archaeon]
MKNSLISVLSVLLILSAINPAYAEGTSVSEKFLGSPLLILVGILIIDLIAFIYHKIRK